VFPKARCFFGQVVTEVEKGGPADKAGIGVGDVILKLNENRIYSQDNIRDFLRVTAPETSVRILLKKAGEEKEETLSVILGKSESAEAKGIAWQFASLEQLEPALALAKKEGRKVLIGISGAET
jgi:C-terminal processing protease CtpA/Prc